VKTVDKEKTITYN